MKTFRNWLLGLVAVCAIAAAGLFGHPVVAQNAGQFLSSLISTDAIQVYRSGTAAITYATPGTIANYVRGTQLLYTTTARVNSSGTTAEQTLRSYSLPASTLNTGTKLRIGASFSAGATTNSKTYKCYFGNSVITSGLLLTNAKNGSCEMIVTMTGASAQIVYANMLVDTTPITGYFNAGTDSGASAITIKFTGTQGSPAAADIILNDFWVERLGN